MMHMYVWSHLHRFALIAYTGGVVSLEPLRPQVREGDGSARVTVSLRGASFQEKGAGLRVDISTSSLTAISKWL